MERSVRQERGENKDGLLLDVARRHKPDYPLLVLTLALLVIGLVVIYAIGPALVLGTNLSSNYYADRQLLAVLLGLIGFFAAANIPLDLLRTKYKYLVGLSIFLTLVAIVMPVNVHYPAHRWIRLGPFSFESVELLMLAIIVWYANFLALRVRRGEVRDMKKMLLPLMVVIVVVGLVIAGLQSDLGSTGVIVIMLTAMAFVAGMPFKRVLYIGAIVAVVLVLAVSTSAYRRARVATFLHPASNCSSTGYQVCQALIAVGSGGFAGQGLGRGVQAYGYLPEADNDSIFAIYAEKFGFIGSAILLAIYVAFFARMKLIAERIQDNFLRFIVIGVMTWLSVQTMINVGAMVGLLPLKGITLPFISYGGTSIVFSLAAVGVVYQISRYTSHQTVTGNEGKDYENRPDGRRLRGAYHASSGGRS